MTVHARTYAEAADHFNVPAAHLPTMYDLPSENPEEPGVPDLFHTWQANLLTETFSPPDFVRERVMTAGDLNLYYDADNTGLYKRPDWFAVTGVPFLYRDGNPRLSYVVWQEDAVPFIVVELLSPGTENEDLGRTARKPERPPTKWEVYERILEIPYYAVYDRHTERLRIHRLNNRKYYEIGLPDNRLWLPEIKLGIGLWRGEYSGLRHLWLRWYDADGNWIPSFPERVEEEKRRVEREKQRTEREKQRAEREKQRTEREKQRTEREKQRAEQEKQRAEQEKLRAEQAEKELEEERRHSEQEKQRAERLAAKLRALGISPD